ncbi:membrane-spanning 4-domains subfamily A member 4A-like isoform X1 [Megalobrama amblycephala]|uniref:membrane-spanning 4-domains subfamily A member 4A-like isoform X1 n=1 Tax=Megalobrama amblycephala TaxID=75352 RepID=UPI0020145262|nr:membrane-spanning 4-domains subfamily A member 4A-like isoform X1 [Megalobrama amblycephala]
METSRIISNDKATVVIQVNPQAAQNAVICDDGQEARGAHHNTALEGFFKAQPKALGTVQIMIGVMIFLLGIVLNINVYHFGTLYVYSGITYWGSFIYISAGSLSVAAQNKLHPCVVKASLGMNVISAITSAIAVLLMGIQIRIDSMGYPSCYYSYSYSENDICIYFERYGWGIIGIMMVLSILQFIISICISGFACKATCNRDSTVVNVALNQVMI